ncbi:hypothetical protein ACP70R_041669 [Stipagrostis hirtigluma subsp. patula]
MELLEHPLEAIAFRLYSLPDSSVAAGTAAWTCLAAVLAAAAAAGLWRLRSSAPAAVTAASKPLDFDPSATKKAPEFSTSSTSDRSPEPAASPALSPKERYTVYYRDAGCVGCCDVDDEEGDNEEENEEEKEQEDDAGAYEPSTDSTDPFGWEVVRSLPLSPAAAADMRRYRSPTALGGSVVRLWDQGADGALTPTASPRRRGRVIGAVSAF